MARRYRRPGLYEVINKYQSKTNGSKAFQWLRPVKSDDGSADKHRIDIAPKLTRWPRKPRIAQFNADRLEISVSYPLLIATLLGILLLVLLAFRAGQWHAKSRQSIAPPVRRLPQTAKSGRNSAALSLVDSVAADVTGKRAKNIAQTDQRKVKAVDSAGDHWIVIVQYPVYADLVPVKKHFAKYGIETEIQKREKAYFLVTRDRYQSPKRQGADGFAARQRIVAVGARYKAPAQYESFAPNLFSDAYGERIK